jgi:hypothetical protein
LGGILFPGDPSNFLLLLGVGTFSITLVGFFFLKVYPHQHSTYHALQGGDGGGDNDDEEDFVPDRPGRLRRTSSKEVKARRANGNDIEPGTSDSASSTTITTTNSTATTPMATTAATTSPSSDTQKHVGEAAAPSREDPDETTPLYSSPCASSEDLVADIIVDLDRSHRVDLRGLKLLTNLEFWQLFLIMAILAGIGLMTIK